MVQSKKQLYESLTKGLLAVGITAKCFSEDIIKFVKEIKAFNKALKEIEATDISPPKRILKLISKYYTRTTEYKIELKDKYKKRSGRKLSAKERNEIIEATKFLQTHYSSMIPNDFI